MLKSIKSTLAGTVEAGALAFVLTGAVPSVEARKGFNKRVDENYAHVELVEAQVLEREHDLPMYIAPVIGEEVPSYVNVDDNTVSL